MLLNFTPQECEEYFSCHSGTPRSSTSSESSEPVKFPARTCTPQNRTPRWGVADTTSESSESSQSSQSSQSRKPRRSRDSSIAVDSSDPHSSHTSRDTDNDADSDECVKWNVTPKRLIVQSDNDENFGPKSAKITDTDNFWKTPKNVTPSNQRIQTGSKTETVPKITKMCQSVMSLTLRGKKRIELTEFWLREFDRRIFGDKLCALEVSVVWNPRLTSTAGLTRIKRNTPPRIELSNKVVTDVMRLKETLLHECCHVAQHLFSDVKDTHPHGKEFRKWMQICNVQFPDIHISVTHSYEIKKKFQFECPICLKETQRFTKILRCQFCHSKNSQYLKRDSQMQDRGDRGGMSSYQEFVKMKFEEAKKNGIAKIPFNEIASQWKLHKSASALSK